MLFLIVYDRTSGELVRFQEFPEAERTRAQDCRLEVEVELLRSGTQREVVLLEAPSDSALRRTHRRYFETAEQLGTPQDKSDEVSPK